ncbi:DUF6286 domain-containing protein [Corynebacterium uterequi]|uniref:DUF6286 domain-containing protein n=1 Tax=Corynebacterium uterequi TaxID=1072256 RepID=A0A0G3HEE1_9CORY|nr:DUF6286 domain-containing protein [Corynebacterium uterequi]AKK10333.1 hypothetical protein CUTER_01585 [Corynebacterium uterequi]
MSDKNPSASTQQPVASPQVRWIAILLSLLLVGLGVFATTEALAFYRQGPDAPYVLDLPGWLTSLSPSAVGFAGAVAIAVALWFLVAALSPRRKRHRQVAGTDASVWVRPVDIARYATARAKAVPGVTSARSKASKKKVTVTALSSAVDAAEQERIRDAISHRLASAFGEDFQVAVAIEAAEPPSLAAVEQPDEPADTAALTAPATAGTTTAESPVTTDSLGGQK